MTTPALLAAIVEQLHHYHEGCDDAAVATDPDGTSCIRLVRGREQISATTSEGAWWVRRTPSGAPEALRARSGQQLHADAIPKEVASAIQDVMWSSLGGYLEAIVDQLRARHGLHAVVDDEGVGPYITFEHPPADWYLVSATGISWHVLLPDNQDVGNLALGGQALTTSATPGDVADAVKHLLRLYATVERLRALGLHATIEGPVAGTLWLRIVQVINAVPVGEGWAMADEGWAAVDADGRDIRVLHQADGRRLPAAAATPEEVAEAIRRLLGVAATADVPRINGNDVAEPGNGDQRR